MKKKLPDICDIRYGFPFDSSLFSDSAGTPVIRIRDVKRGYSETYTTETCDDSYIVNAGNLLVGMDGEFNIAKWGNTPSLLNQRVCRLFPKKCVDEKYLFWYLQGALKEIENRTSFATVKHLSAKELNKLFVPLPEISLQKKMGKTLEKVTSLISLRKQQLAKLDELVKSRFIEMFGDETNPFHWDVVFVENVADVQVGVVIKPAQYYTDAEHGIRTFRSLNIGSMYIKDTDWVYFTEEGNEKNAKSQLSENDLLIVRSGAPGTACVVTKEYSGCNAVDIIIAHPNTDKVNPYYLCTYTNMPHGKKQIEAGTGGAAQQHFNVGKYNKLRLMLPPMEKQTEFVAFVEQVDKSKFGV